MKLKKETTPILSPNPYNGWESLVTSNPGVIYDNGRFHMLYRAAGEDEGHVITFGLAESEDGIHFTRMSDKPVFAPSIEGPDSGCVEDPRIVKFGDTFFITYAYRPYHPGRYWTFAHDEVLTPQTGEESPYSYRENVTNTGLAMTRDFRHFVRLGRITPAVLDDRDVILFPEKVGGKYVRIHRPKEFVGKEYGVDYPSIWMQFSDDLLSWEDKPSTLLMQGIKGGWEEKIGGATPPVRTSEGWLMLYHGVADGGTSVYSVGAVLLDADDPTRVIARTPEPILEPDLEFETQGLYNRCVFPCGNAVVDGTLYVYYGAADKYVGLATCRLQDLIDYLKNECRI